jgi:phosphoribosyl 1,2-cyclic phosphodiesterase
MSLFIASLNSGSNGNCYYIGNETDAVLIDAGISCRETEIRMKKIGLDPARLRAVFISHEHTDHTRGVQVLSKKWDLPVYISRETLLFSGLQLEKHLIRDMKPAEEISVGGITVTGFSKHHDAADPFSFIVSNGDSTVGVFTDIGQVCPELTRHFRKCNAAFLESNYDEKMLEEGNYPIHLKRRIRGGKGHLSNSEALDLYCRYKPSGLSHLLLSHLSKNNNCPGLVKDLFEPHAGATKIVVASRYEASEVYHIQPLEKQLEEVYFTPAGSQLALFA